MNYVCHHTQLVTHTHLHNVQSVHEVHVAKQCGEKMDSREAHSERKIDKGKLGERIKRRKAWEEIASKCFNYGYLYK